ncbi:uncharacterized protein LOC126728109 [Quercus robur]|uniref:uncharacterized protein LOC126728109 n=1 Tax=Quercus robur TaxID=38942 RepID=UPI002162F147|nr:uncharacterized protein LOC126728109 [Quercus robur]
MLRSYITRFNKEALSIDEADNKILVVAFTNGLRKGKFLFSLYKNNPKTMSEVFYRATKYVNAEDTLLAREDKPRKRERQEDSQQDRGRKMIKDEGTLMFPDKLKGDPSKRQRDKYYCFHRDHRHDTADCYNLKQQIEALIRQGKLQRFVSKEKADPPQGQTLRRENEHPRPPIADIRMIVGGMATSRSSKKARKTYLRIVQNVQLTGTIPKMARIDNPVIGFSEEDARKLHHPYDNVLVVRLRVGDYNMHRVLVNNGSSADILYYPAFQQMRVDREQLVPVNAPLIGFRGMGVFPINAVTLTVTVGDYPQQITKEVTFLVVDCSFTYNVHRGTTNNSRAS